MREHLGGKVLPGIAAVQGERYDEGLGPYPPWGRGQQASGGTVITGYLSPAS